MIKGVFVINTSGKARLVKFYDYKTAEEQQRLVRDFHLQLSKRTESMCNFLEWEDDTKLIYRHYATLYFVFWVDSSESELAILDLIHTLVETLDRCYKNVCEVDLIFNVDKVNYVVDEIVMGGMVHETKMEEVILVLSETKKLEMERVGSLGDILKT